MITRSQQTPAGTGMERTLARRWSLWEEVGGLLPIVAAVALWVAVLAGVAAPLGEALARMERGGRREPGPLSCPVPEGALASARTALTPPSSPCPEPSGRTARGR